MVHDGKTLGFDHYYYNYSYSYYYYYYQIRQAHRATQHVRPYGRVSPYGVGRGGCQVPQGAQWMLTPQDDTNISPLGSLPWGFIWHGGTRMRGRW